MINCCYIYGEAGISMHLIFPSDRRLALEATSLSSSTNCRRRSSYNTTYHTSVNRQPMGHLDKPNQWSKTHLNPNWYEKVQFNQKLSGKFRLSKIDHPKGLTFSGYRKVNLNKSDVCNAFYPVSNHCVTSTKLLSLNLICMVAFDNLY